MENFRQQPNIWRLKVVLFFRLESSKRKFFLLLLHDRIFDTSFRPSQPFFGKRSIFKCKTVNATPGRNYQSWLILITIWPKEWTDRFAHVKMVNKPKLLHTFRKGQRTSVTSERGLRAIERLNYQSTLFFHLQQTFILDFLNTAFLHQGITFDSREKVYYGGHLIFRHIASKYHTT